MPSLFQVFLVWFARHNAAVFSPESEGEVLEELEPGRRWWVKHQATEWSARSRSGLHFRPGDRVRIIDRQGTTLLIEHLDEH